MNLANIDFDKILNFELFNNNVEQWLIVIALFIALKFVILPKSVNRILEGLFIIIIIFQVIKFIQAFIIYFFNKISEKEQESERNSEMAIKGITLVIKIILWTIGFLLILSNLGLNVSTLVASLGIGGIAVALAVQSILSDIFSSFSIYFDRPFEIGDFIIVGEHMGTVKDIGIKTTRIQSLQGEEVIISNKELTSTRIQNFKRMQQRRIVFKIGVNFETSLEKLKRAGEIIKETIKIQENVQLERVHFVNFGDYSLNFEAVYFVLNSDYNLYMDIQQNINFEIKESFEREGINMAYPTQMVYVTNH